MEIPILRIERRSMGIYPYLFYAGDYFWPLSPEAIATLKRHADDPPEAFLKQVIEAAAITKYLRHEVEEALAGVTNRDVELRALQQMVRTL